MIRYALSFLCLVFSLQMVHAQQTKFRTAKDHVVPLTNWEVRNSKVSEWKVFNPDSAKYLKGYNEFRTQVLIEGDLDEFEYLVLRFYGPLSSYQLYWDDRLLLENGIVSNEPSKEKPGQLLRTVKLPRNESLPGVHTIRLHVSNWNAVVHPFLKNDLGLNYTYVGYGHLLVASENKAILFISLGAGVLVLTALFSLVLFYSGNTFRSYVLLSIFCLLNVAVLLLQYVELYFAVNMAYFTALSLLLILLSALQGVYLCYFFISHFELTWKKISFVALLIVSFATQVFINFDYNFYAMTGIAILLSGYASYLKKIGSLSALIGLIGMLIIYLFTRELPYAPGYAFGSIFFAYTMIFSIGKQIKHTNQLKLNLELKSAQLEMSMIKKSIQPHFIMNTLLSIISWLESQPKIAIKLIQALAREFRMINDISSKSEITIQDELDLCTNHLEIMSLRKGTKYTLMTDNLPLDYKLPPMIFHTLMENALTHAFQSGEEGIFWLSHSSDDSFDRFTLKNNGSQLKINGSSQEGMGITFVRSQLKARYERNWTLNVGMEDELWVVDIRVHKS